MPQCERCETSHADNEVCPPTTCCARCKLWVSCPVGRVPRENCDNLWSESCEHCWLSKCAFRGEPFKYCQHPSNHEVYPGLEDIDWPPHASKAGNDAPNNEEGT